MQRNTSPLICAAALLLSGVAHAAPSASLSTDGRVSRTCPATLNFNGVIRSDRAGEVQYRFLRSDGASAPVKTVRFDRPGSRRVTTTWRLGRSYTGWQQIEVLYPQSALSPKARFELNCRPQGKPDLKVVPRVSDTSLRRGQNFNIELDVTNAGHRPAQGNSSARAGYVVDVFLSTDRRGPARYARYDSQFNEDVLLRGGRASNTNTLAAGRSRTYRVSNTVLPQNTPSGRLFVCAKVDPGNAVQESAENNNTRCTAINVASPNRRRPDLQVDITAPERARRGAEIGARVNVTARNTGRGVARGSRDGGYMIDVFLSSDRVGPRGYARYSENYSEDVLLRGGRISNTDDLGSGASRAYPTPTSAVIPRDTPRGNYFICAKIDSGEQVAEGNENNNVSCAPIRVGKRSRRPDLTVDITAPGRVVPGQDIGSAISLTAKNAGRRTARGTNTSSDGYMIDVFLSSDNVYPTGYAIYSAKYKEDVLLRGGRVSNTQDLGRGASANYSTGAVIPANTPPGRYNICARIDSGNKVREANEDNNVSCAAVRVQPPRAAPLVQGCSTFDPNGLSVSRNGTEYVLSSGRLVIGRFLNRRLANQAKITLARYQANEYCRIGGSPPSFTYFLRGGKAFGGFMLNEDCLKFKRSKLEVKRVNGSWKIIQGSRWLFDFGGKEAEARAALAAIKKYRFRRSCFVGRGGGLGYLRR